MLLRYRDLDGKVHNTKAKITTDHPASSYGQPVIVLPDGSALDLISWIGLGYEVVRATAKEREQLERIFSDISLLFL